MDPLTKKHIGYLDAYLSSLSVYNSNWRTTSNTTTVSDALANSSTSDILIQIQHHNPQIISDEQQKEDNSGFFPPIRITWTPDEGRHLVASRDITAGEMLFWEPPLLLSPKAGTGPICLNCLRSLPENFSSCEGCGSPLCVPHCSGSGHTEKECQSFTSGMKESGQESQTQTEEKDASENITSENKMETSTENITSENEMESDEHKQSIRKKVNLLNCLMTPLRTLLLIQESSSASDTIAAMQSNAEQRSMTPLGKFLERQLLSPLRNCLGYQLPKSVLHHVCGVWNTNAFEMKMDNGGVGRGLFPVTALMNHSCVPNTQHWSYRGGFIVMASIDIAQGTSLMNNYVKTFMGTIPRQSHLQTTKLFVCRCIRCSDPSELGSNASALMCHKCKQGLLQPPQEAGNIWKCNECSADLPNERASMVVQMAARMIAASEKQDLKCKRNMQAKICHILGEQHYLSKELQFMVLVDILKQPIQDVNLQDLKSALGVIEDLIKYTGLIEPGYTKFKGVFLLRHLQVTTELLRRCHRDNKTLTTLLAGEDEAVGHTDENIHKLNIQEIKALSPLLSECLMILQYDDVLVQELKEVGHKLQTQLNDMVT